MTVKVKVCGITNRDDAVLALECGADALGFNFYRPSPRWLEPEDASEIIHRLPPLVTTVGVFVNVPDPANLARIASAAGVGVLQLHGDETPGYCRRLAGSILIKALRVSDQGLSADPEKYAVQAFLLDTKDEVLFGGTGKAFDWSLVSDFPRRTPVILSGGLNPGNVGRAIRLVRPYAVDVCSGVESSAGKKDASKLRAFIDEVRNAATEIDRSASHTAR